MSVLVPYVGITNTIPELVESGTSGFSAVSNGYFNGLTSSVKQTYNSSNNFPLDQYYDGSYSARYFICPNLNLDSETILSNSFKAGSDQLTSTATKTFSGPGELILTNFYVTKDANLTINKAELVVSVGSTKYTANVGSDNGWAISDDVRTSKFETRYKWSSSSGYKDDYLRFNGYFWNPSSLSPYIILASASYSSKVYVDGRDITSTISGFSTGTNSYKIPFNDTIQVRITRTINNTPTQLQPYQGTVAFIRCKADSSSHDGHTYYNHTPNYNHGSYTIYPSSSNVALDLEKVYYNMDSSIYQYSYYLY